MLLLVVLCVSARADPPVVDVTFTLGRSTALVGTPVQMHCRISGVFIPLIYKWYHQRYLGSERRLAATSQNLTLQRPVVEDSGNYTCAITTDNGMYTKTVVLTLIEKLSPLSVVVVPQHVLLWEGSRVTLRCVATSEPPAMAWSWERLEWGGSVVVGSRQELNLCSVEDSGVYRCLGRSSEQSVLQEETSGNHSVLIVDWQQSPALASHVSMSVASFVLVLLAWAVLLVVVAMLCLQLTRVKKVLNSAAAHTSTAGLSGPASGSKTTQGGAGREDLYINSCAVGQSYCNLDLSEVAEDNVYDNLS